MDSTTVPDELKHTAHQKQPGIVVLTVTKLMQGKPVCSTVPTYTLVHSCIKGNGSGHSRTGSGGVAINGAQMSHKPALSRAD